MKHGGLRHTKRCVSGPPPHPHPHTSPQFRSKEGGAPAPKPFVPSGSSHQRLSMRAVNPYSVDARPADTNAASFL